METKEGGKRKGRKFTNEMFSIDTIQKEKGYQREQWKGKVEILVGRIELKHLRNEGARPLCCGKQPRVL